MPQLLNRDFRLGPAFYRMRIHRAMIGASLIALALLLLIVGLAEVMYNDATHGGTWPRVTEDASTRVCLSSHEPIMIVGNSAFNDPNATTGVIMGSGSASDPYIIAGWDINASGANGVYIEDVDVHFMIRDCYIHDGMEFSHAGIYLYRCSNGTVINNTCVNDWDGVYVSLSKNIAVVDNNCSYDDGGVILSRSVNITLRNNTMWGNGISVTGDTVEECRSHDIDTSNTVNGKPIFYCKDKTALEVPEGVGQVILANCTHFLVEGMVFEDATCGVMILFSSGTVIRNNICMNSVYGILLWHSNGTSVANNTCTNDALTDYWWGGIALISSSWNSILDNVCSKSSYGLVLQESDNNIVTGNALTSNLNGVLLQSSHYNELTRNEMRDNAMFGAMVVFSVGNTISNNIFVGNNGASDTYDPLHIQASEVGMENAWNDTEGCGNYWADWTAPDLLPPYGRVDVPYEIDGPTDSKDEFPLTEYPPHPIPEFGSFPETVIALLVATVLAALARRSRKQG